MVIRHSAKHSSKSVLRGCVVICVCVVMYVIRAKVIFSGDTSGIVMFCSVISREVKCRGGSVFWSMESGVVSHL